MPRTRLTEKAVEKIKPAPAGKRVEYFDALVPGLALRVTDRGRKSWVVFYRHPGTLPLRRLTLDKAWPTLGLKKAREKAREALEAVTDGRDPAKEKKAARKAPMADTFKARAEDFMRLHVEVKLRPTTAAEYRRHLIKTFMPAWRDRPLSSIRKGDVIAVLDEIAARAPIDANRHLATISKLFNWAAARDLIDFSPVVGIERPGDETARDHRLTDDEIKAVWRACTAMGYPFGTHLLLSLVTAQRRTATAHIRRSDLRDGLWEQPQITTKGNRALVVPLTPLATALIDSCPTFAGGDYLLSTMFGRKPIGGFGKALIEVREKAGISDWRPHDFRRTFSAIVRPRGVSHETVGAVLGHARQGVTAKHYDAYDMLAEKRQALEVWAGYLAGLVEGRKADVVPIRR